MSGFAVVCPGQGTQSPDMFDLACADPHGAEVIAEFSDALDCDLLARVKSGEGLSDNRLAQPAMVASALATWTLLAPRLPAPALFAGYSVGEVSAWSCAGAWDIRQTAAVIRTRAKLMDEAAPPGCGMLAVMGLDARSVRTKAAEASLHVAIVNDADHVVLAGRVADIQAAGTWFDAHGARTRRLDVRVPSHTPMMSDAARAFETFLQASSWSPVDAPVLRGIDGRAVERGEDGVLALSRALAEPIRWDDCMQALVEAGVTVVLELGPGRSLTKLCADAHPHLVVRSVADFRSADGVATWLERQL